MPQTIIYTSHINIPVALPVLEYAPNDHLHFSHQHSSCPPCLGICPKRSFTLLTSTSQLLSKSWNMPQTIIYTSHINIPVALPVLEYAPNDHLHFSHQHSSCPPCLGICPKRSFTLLTSTSQLLSKSWNMPQTIIYTSHINIPAALPVLEYAPNNHLHFSH